ncbi:MAG: aminoglycoside phosphotransferase family protein [Bacilli bacterium]|nr:aminoglycoside phosphotransferase family protein [Bacilli bacterium]
MDEIKALLRENNYEVKDIEVSPNSFSSSVYIVTLESIDKIVVKFSYNDIKLKKEIKYLNYLKDKVTVPVVLNTFDNAFIMSYVEGNNYKDEEAIRLNNQQINDMGINLARIHSLPVIDDDNWKEYLSRRINESYVTLTGVMEQSLLDKINNYLLGKLDTLTYIPSILHLDYRIGNIMFNDSVVAVIDFESATTGDYHFDFVKLSRLLTREQFIKLLDGYQTIKKIDQEFYNRVEFYNIFDAFCTLDWCIKRNRLGDDFYRQNLEILEEKNECNFY